jgi:hypothetical protein
VPSLKSEIPYKFHFYFIIITIIAASIQWTRERNKKHRDAHQPKRSNSRFHSRGDKNKPCHFWSFSDRSWLKVLFSTFDYRHTIRSRATQHQKANLIMCSDGTTKIVAETSLQYELVATWHNYVVSERFVNFWPGKWWRWNRTEPLMLIFIRKWNVCIL